MWLLEVLKWLVWRPLQAVIEWIYSQIHKVVEPYIVVPYHRYLHFSYRTPIQSVYEELRRQQQKNHSTSGFQEVSAVVVKRIEPKIREIVQSYREEESEEADSSSTEELDSFLQRRPFSEDVVERVIRAKLEPESLKEVLPQIQIVLTKLKRAAEARLLYP